MERIVAIELLAAAQAIDFRRAALPQAQLGRGTRAAYELIRRQVSFIDRDVVMYPHMDAIHRLVRDGTLRQAVDAALAGEQL